MKTPFIIYIRAVGIYALLTLPALFLPVVYFISMIYVLFYGWFAWAIFTVIYLVTIFCNPHYYIKMMILFLGFVLAVLFAFQMLEVLGTQQNIWQSGVFLLFPLTAVFSGWMSLGQSTKTIKVHDRDMLLNFPERQISEENNLV